MLCVYVFITKNNLAFPPPNMSMFPGFAHVSTLKAHCRGFYLTTNIVGWNKWSPPIFVQFKREKRNVLLESKILSKINRFIRIIYPTTCSVTLAHNMSIGHWLPILYPILSVCLRLIFFIFFFETIRLIYFENFCDNIFLHYFFLLE